MIIDPARREFSAKVVADLGKTIFAVGLASYFFEKLPFGVRIILSVVCVIMLLGSILIQPPKNQGD